MARLFILLLLAIPIIEIIVIWLVGRALGFWPTLFLLVLTSVLGIWLARREGRQTWRVLQLQIQNQQTPTGVALDGICILFGGFLLIAPGFLTDLLGFMLILPFTRTYIKGFVRYFFNKVLMNRNIMVIRR
ncbi:FxsA family protein [Salicibibacter cibarius]|uniref:FxsA family protein n=1 Tax=Salicibibacter cibarius TaxID=2743000 RepID=A0A7T6Z5J5_9BACI|nr:FxsA family protein [Salicibibacter cibarius]QQK77290.1 FxsA family protein [Salicibibacter cibarius]